MELGYALAIGPSKLFALPGRVGNAGGAPFPSRANAIHPVKPANTEGSISADIGEPHVGVEVSSDVDQTSRGTNISADVCTDSFSTTSRSVYA